MSCPILTVKQMRDWESSTWHTGQTEQAVIARVGSVIARRVKELFPEETRILIIAGKGNNGNDARQACPHLGDFEVELLEINDPTKQLPDLKKSLAQQPGLVIDALFGIGLNRPLNQAWMSVIETINSADSSFVLSVDSPSGMNCDTGLPEGAAIRADTTLTFGAPKTGLLRNTAWPFVGRLEVAPEIGLTACTAESKLQWSLQQDFQHVVPTRRAASHKGSYGHLVIFAGSPGYHGAAVLAARGAQSAHPGLITVVTTKKAYGPVASQLQSAMVRPWDSKWRLPENATAVLFGPGLADDNVPSSLRKLVQSIWRSAKYPVVADASGLDWLPQKNTKTPGTRVVTPHPGEAARLLKQTIGAIQKNRPDAALKLSKKLGSALVVLKGHQTLVGSATGNLFFNGTGSPMLAQGGSGDVLAGYLAGLLAQPDLQNDALLTTRYAVWRHGKTAESRDWNGLIDELPLLLATPVADAV
jgi:hydroxyethylthiazole kinase-like uncharacterized protein yjeF